MFAQDFNELGYLSSHRALNHDLPTILMVHGAGLNHAQWNEQLTGLRDHANMIAVDLPGHAMSAHHGGDQSIAHYAHTLSELAEELGSEQLILAGHSMGGAVCLEFAMQYPDQLAGLVLVNTGARLKVQSTFLEQIHDDYPLFVRTLAQYALNDTVDQDISNQFIELLMQSERSAVFNDFSSCNSFDRLDDIGEIVCPALVISSDQDKMTPPKYGEFLAEQLKQSDFALIEGAAHLSPMEQPEAVNGAIISFLNRLNGH